MFKRLAKNHPIICGIFAFFFISLPQWFSAIWSLFSTTPFIQWLMQNRIPMIHHFPQLSLNWITVPVGMAMFVFIIWQNRKVKEKPRRKTKNEKLRESVDKIYRKYFPEKYIEIESATWKAAVGKPFVVTDTIRAHLVDGKLEMHCTVDAFGDPFPGQGKVLTIKYKFGNEEKEKLFAEGQIAKLP